MSKVLLLGGVGTMANVTVEDLVKTSNLERITIADCDVEKAEEFAATLKDDRVSVVKVDASNVSNVVKLMRGYDVVANGLPRSFYVSFIKAAIEAKVDCIDITSPTPESLALDGEAKKAGISCVGGCGWGPGVDNFLAQLGVERLDSVEQIDIDFAVFKRGFISPGLMHSSMRGFDPGEKFRYAYEDGKLVEYPPFSGAKVVNFPEPIGKQTVYIVPHGQVLTFSKNVKGIKKVYERGCHTPEFMRLFRAFNDYGIFTAGPMEFEGRIIIPLDFLKKYLLSLPLRETGVFGTAKQVEVTGILNGKRIMLRFVPSYLRKGEAMNKRVGYPLSIGIQFLAQGKAKKRGVDGVEAMFSAQEFMAECKKRGITYSEETIEL